MKKCFVVLGTVAALFALATGANSQCRLDKMQLRSAALPMYVPLARQARIQGDVVVSFDVSGDGLATPTNIKVVTGHPVLAEGTELELGTWKLFMPGEKLHEHNCQTTFRYSLSKKDASGAPDLNIRFHGLSIVEIHTDPPAVEADDVDSCPRRRDGIPLRYFSRFIVGGWLGEWHRHSTMTAAYGKESKQEVPHRGT